MKKNLFIILLGLLLVLIVSCENSQVPTSGVITTPTSREIGPEMIDPNVQPCGEPKTVELWAGQTTDAGSVTIYNDETNLYITVYSELGYQTADEQIKLWVGMDLSTIDGGGLTRPSAGQFPYKYTLDNPAEAVYTAVILLDDIQLVNECDDEIYVVVHADVLADDGNGNGGTTGETAWGGEIPGLGDNAWWYYTNYTIQCCGGGGGGGFDVSETAFAKGTHVFASKDKANPEGLPSLELTKMRWGWAINITEDGQTYYDIWAGAGLNDTDKGTLVGELVVNKIGDDVNISYNLDPGYEMQEVHIYAGDLEPETIAPGQYGHIAYFDPMEITYNSDFFIEDIDNDGIWIIAHAVVCWEE
ncbi:MAG: hypothetical protein U9P73_10750 [Candidatus Cloacimonadota bacterium]|nr:hypothetical protein [Candidatus Cloacimonadota bacterium]